MTINKLGAAIAAGTVAAAISFGVGTNYAQPPKVVTHSVVHNHTKVIHTLPICGVEGPNGIEPDDECILPADMNDTDPNGPYAGQTLIIHNGDVYTVDDGGMK